MKIEPELASEVTPEHKKSLPNGRQQGGAFGAAPRGLLLSSFGKDFLCFGLTSEAHSGSIFIEIGRFSEFSQGSSEKVYFVPPR